MAVVLAVTFGLERTEFALFQVVGIARVVIAAIEIMALGHSMFVRASGFEVGGQNNAFVLQLFDLRSEG